jgi:hypothetical protein
MYKEKNLNYNAYRTIFCRFESFLAFFCNIGGYFKNKLFLKKIYVVFDCEDFRSYIVKSCFEIIWNSIEAVGINSIKLFATEVISAKLLKII